MTAGETHHLAPLLRELAPRVLGALAARTGDFAAAEDAVQEALLAATAQWPGQGLPANPGGWLFHVAMRRARDAAAAERARRRRQAEAAPPAAADPDADACPYAPHGDDTLKLLLLCCHPSLSPPSAIALTLRAVAGLTTAEIASAFLVPEATMAQRISRAKAAIRRSGLPFALPAETELPARLDAVLHVLYLMFNEGHASSSGPQLLRGELSAEAIRLARQLHVLRPEHTETVGLLALLLLIDARRASRTGPHGELVTLPEQDRSRWDRAAIAEGTALLAQALARGRVGSYQLQAAIQALHDEAPSAAATDWPQILALYGLLQQIADNPIVALNRAVAVAMVHGPARGLQAVDAIAGDERLCGNHRVDAVRAHCHELAGDLAAARRHLLLAAERAPSLAERHWLLAKADRLAGG